MRKNRKYFNAKTPRRQEKNRNLGALAPWHLMLVICLFSTVTYSETSAQPVEISASKSLEWNRREKTYTAREKVLVMQGTMRIQSDILTARYDDDKGMTISTLEAKNNIVIQSPPYAAYGDAAFYDVRTGNATLTGKALKITFDADMMTARDKIEFFGAENRLVASGKATATHGQDRVTADSLSAYFSKDSAGKLAVSKIIALGDVTIQTLRETITGDRGVYDIPAQKAVLTGKVRIRQGENWLEGTRANVDMATGISQLSGSGNAETEGRVKGVFFPPAPPQKTESQTERQ